MKNLKKSQIERVASVDQKRNISVIKCFICNQIYYSQPTFDDHMQQHSSKLTKTIPNQIQRKTLQSFRNKKCPMVKASQTNSDKKWKILQNKGEEKGKIKGEEQLIKQNKQQIQYTQEALRQSALLIQKIEALTNQPLNSQTEQHEQYIEQRLSYSQQSSPQIQQQQLIKIYLSGQKLTPLLICSTKFSNMYLKSYQEQLSCLNQLLYHFSGSRMEEKKIQDIRYSILSAIQEEIKSKKEEKIEVIQLNQEKMGEQLNESEFEIVENTQLCYCNSCLMNIDCQQQCYTQKQTTMNGTQNKIKYHIQCWSQ